MIKKTVLQIDELFNSQQNNSKSLNEDSVTTNKSPNGDSDLLKGINTFNIMSKTIGTGVTAATSAKKIIEKNVFYYNQKITYISQNIYGLIQNIISTLWMLLLFALVFKGVVYLALFIIIFCALLFVLINYFSKVVLKIYRDYY